MLRAWLKRMARGALIDPGEPTTSEGWDRYAREFNRRRGGHLGDEWNLPAALGVDLEPAEIVPYVMREIVEPFLGACDTMLEIGPGGGRWTAILLPRCRRLLAADTSATMLAMLRERFAGDERIEYVQLGGRDLGPVPEASVDAVFSFDVFVHLPQWDVFAYLREIHRVLRPGGDPPPRQRVLGPRLGELPRRDPLHGEPS